MKPGQRMVAENFSSGYPSPGRYLADELVDHREQEVGLLPVLLQTSTDIVNCGIRNFNLRIRTGLVDVIEVNGAS
jgi:hypothetical protein